MLQFIDRGLNWSENNGLQGVFSKRVLDTWFEYRQIHLKDREAGGVLMGKFVNNSKAMLVEELTTPMFLDRRKRTMFYRSKSHDRALKKYWKNTKGFGGLLGLWHTHPENIPIPSHTDMNDLIEQLNESQYVTNRLIYIIVGITHIGVWAGYKSNDIRFIGHIKFETKSTNYNSA